MRLASAAVGLPILGALIWVGGWPFALAAGVIAFLAAAEFVHGFLLPSRPMSATFGLAPAFATVGLMVAGAHWSWQLLLVGVLAGGGLLTIGFSGTNRFGPRKPMRVLGAAHFYVGLLLATFVLLRDLADGRSWVFLAILATFAVDTGAYAVGKLVGRHKMAPAISPGKTWEGAAGGYVAGAAAVFALRALLDVDLPVGGAIVLALALPPFAMAGDLLESFLKRRMGIKDASGFIPGHGGFLDRLDSLLFVVPLVYVTVKVLG